MTGPDFAEIRAEMERRIAELARQLVPTGRKNGAYWIGKSPVRADRHAGSFWVLLTGRPGVWKDEATGETGDVIKLVMHVERLADYKAARAWCLDWLGWGGDAPQVSAEERRRRAAARAAEEARRARDEAQELARKRKSAFGLWMNAGELTAETFPGSLPDIYLRTARAIDLTRHWLDKGRALPGALRFEAAHNYHLAGGGRRALPCIVALMSGPDGTPRAVHRTWLTPDGADKAALPDPHLNPPRKIWPHGWDGAAIRLSKGAGQLSPEQAARKGRITGPLVITEGIEDGLSVMLAEPDKRVWAAGTLGNIGKVPVPACADRVIVCADNDWNKPQAMAALDAAVAALKRAGKPVRVARSPAGKDFNDLLKGETA